MAFLFAVLLLWAGTASLGEFGDSLPPQAVWAIWSVLLYLCGGAAVKQSTRSLLSKTGCILGYGLVVLYYTTQLTTEGALAFLPVDAGNPNLWPTIFLVVNVAGPVFLVTVGCLKDAVMVDHR